MATLGGNTLNGNQLLVNLYLDNMRELVEYGGIKRKRVKNVKQWRLITEKLGNDSVLDITSMQHEYDNIWLWSDQHFWHDNVIHYSVRPFKNVEEMNEVMITNYNSVVGDNDLVIWGGDVAFGAVDRTNTMLDSLKGNKLLVLGNHDFNKNKPRALNFDYTCVLGFLHYEGIDYVLSHYPMHNLPSPMINIHGHVHHYPSPKPLMINISVEQGFVDYTPTLLEFVHQLGRARLDI